MNEVELIMFKKIKVLSAHSIAFIQNQNQYLLVISFINEGRIFIVAKVHLKKREF